MYLCHYSTNTKVSVIMNINMWLVYFVLMLYSFTSEIHGWFNVAVKRFELCDLKADYPNKFYGTIRTVEGKQYCDGNATLTAAIDNDITSNCTIELLVGKRYIPVIKFEEKHTCSSIHRYFGEFAYDMERAAALVPGLCPIPAGRYHIHNYLLNFNKMTLQNVPFGQLRITEIATDKNNKLFTCVVAEVENQP